MWSIPMPTECRNSSRLLFRKPGGPSNLLVQNIVISVVYSFGRRPSGVGESW